MLAKTKHYDNADRQELTVGGLSRASLAKVERLDCANDAEVSGSRRAAPSRMSRRAERSRMMRINDHSGWRLSTW